MRGGSVPLKTNADKALEPARRSTPGRGPGAVATRSNGSTAATSGTTRRLPPLRSTARQRWTPMIRCSSSIPRVRPANPRAYCTPPAATCCRRDDAQDRVRLHDGEVYWCTADVGWDRPQLHRVRPAGQRRDITLMFEAFRPPGHARSFLAGLRQAQRRHLLYRADRDPLTDGRR